MSRDIGAPSSQIGGLVNTTAHPMMHPGGPEVLASGLLLL